MWRNKKRSGFGLIEVMAALTIIMIVMGAASAITTRSIAVTGSSQDKIVAAGLAQEYIEQVRGLNTATLPKTSYNRPVNKVSYKVELTVKKDTPSSGARMVIAKVTWTDRATHNPDQSYTLETVLTDWRQ
jgi:Tfp pilus assembly protein PilV